MGNLHVTYRDNQSEDNGYLPSNSIWHRGGGINNGPPSRQEIKEGIVQGIHRWEQWDNAPVFASATEEYGYTTYQDTGVTIQFEATTPADRHFGCLEIAGNDADNDEGSIQLTNDYCVISDTDAEAYGLAFEARFKKASVADNGLAHFVGLAATGFAAANALVDDTGAMKDVSHIGFHTDAADGDSLDWVYTLAGQTDTVQISGLDALAADTFVKVGFLYLPNAPGDKRIRCFLNGLEQSTYITADEISASDFPDSIEMAPAIATKTGTASNEVKFQCSWMRWAQWVLT